MQEWDGENGSTKKQKCWGWGPRKHMIVTSAASGQSAPRWREFSDLKYDLRNINYDNLYVIPNLPQYPQFYLGFWISKLNSF